MTINKLTAIVIEETIITDNLMVIKIKPNSSFTYRPGQYCTVGVNGTERPYSIVSAPHEEYIELFVELVPHGALTSNLWKVNSGDVINIRPKARGIFTLEEGCDNQFMIATVTGVAPILSMIRDSLHRGLNSHRFYIIHGASFAEELAYRSKLEALSRIHDNIFYIPTVRRSGDPKNSGWHGETGRVNTIFYKYIDKFSLDHESTVIYACGHPRMIEDVKAQATIKGFGFKEEKYWRD